MLTTVQELEMVDSLVKHDKWPREKAEDVVRAVSTRLSNNKLIIVQAHQQADLNALLAELRAQNILTALESLQVRQYLFKLYEPPQNVPQNVYLVSNIC